MSFLILFFNNNLKIVKVWRDVQERHQRVQDQLLQGALRIQPLHPIHDRQGDIRQLGNCSGSMPGVVQEQT